MSLAGPIRKSVRKVGWTDIYFTETLLCTILLVITLFTLKNTLKISVVILMSKINKMI